MYREKKITLWRWSKEIETCQGRINANAVSHLIELISNDDKCDGPEW
jgi:hypothetical protein